jgi:hypothetical protein
VRAGFLRTSGGPLDVLPSPPHAADMAETKSHGGKHPALVDVMHAIRKAVESQDIEALASLYAEDAVLEEVSEMNPPGHPTVARGRDAIRKRLREQILHDPVSGWSRQVASSAVVDELETSDAVAFTQVWTYAAGDKVVLQHFARKRDGEIEHDRLMIARDMG